MVQGTPGAPISPISPPGSLVVYRCRGEGREGWIKKGEIKDGVGYKVKKGGGL